MEDPRLSEALRSLPRVGASPGFTDGVRTAIAAANRRRRRRTAAVALAAVLLPTAWLGWQQHQKQVRQERLQLLQSEITSLASDLESLRSFHTQVRAIEGGVPLAASEDTVVILDLENLARRLGRATDATRTTDPAIRRTGYRSP